IIMTAVGTNHGEYQIPNSKNQTPRKSLGGWNLVLGIWFLEFLPLLHDPGIVAGEKFFELAAALLGHDILDLLVEKIVVGRALHAPVHADAFRKARIDHSTEQISQAGLLGLFVVDEQVVNRDAATQSNHFRIHSVQANALVAVLAENERLTVFEVQGVIRLDAFVGGVIENAVVEDLAVLINLNEGCAFMSRGAFQNFRQMIDVDVDGTGDKSGLSADGQRQRPQGIVDRPQWAGFRPRSRARSR